MANYSVNQNRQMYVVNKFSANIADADPVGTIGGVNVIKDGLKKKLFFLYKGVDGVMKSDYIQLDNLNEFTPIAAAAQRVPLKSVKVTLDSKVNGGEPLPGREYVMRIEFKQFFSDADDSQYFKNACVFAYEGMDKDAFYRKLKESLDMNFSREVGATKNSNPYLKFDLILEEDPNDSTKTIATGVKITEKPQEWELGTKRQRRIQFNVVPSTIYTNLHDVIWGEVEDVTPARLVKKGGSGADKDDLIPNPALVAADKDITWVGNGKKIADLEYFCMGERGDQYHMVGWPNVINTKYLIKDPSKEYNLIEIHHAFTDAGIHSYRSEKDITIVGESAEELNKFINAVNGKAELSIPTL